MFDVPLDAWYAWVGLALASVAVLGVAAALPTAPPPDASGVAGTVDRVAAESHPATAEHPVAAAEVRLSPHGIGLRNGAGRTHAAFAFGPVTPVDDGSALNEVLRGTPPRQAFENRTAFQQAVVDARVRDPRWDPAGPTVVVRRVSWDDYDVTLVGA
jgi:hypothetical protein